MQPPAPCGYSLIAQCHFALDRGAHALKIAPFGVPNVDHLGLEVCLGRGIPMCHRSEFPRARLDGINI
jgi:hypothetical protein